MIQVNSIPGYTPLKVAVPKPGDRFLINGRNISTARGHSYHEIIVEENESEPGDRLFTVPVEGVPEGFRAADFGYPYPGAYSIRSEGTPEEWSNHQTTSWLLLEKDTVSKKNKISVNPPQGYRIVGFRPAGEGEPFLYGPGNIQYGPSFGPEFVLQALDEVEIGVPEGYEILRWGRPRTGECYIDTWGEVATAGLNMSTWRVIVESPWVEPTEATGQQARFRDPGGSWFEGTLVAIGVDEDGEQFYVDSGRSCWNYCEVKSQDFI